MLEIKGVTKVFQAGGQTVRALNGVSFSLAPGGFLTVVGSNGAGKSTLLDVIAGVHAADSGSLVLAGADISRQPEHGRSASIARVLQNPATSTFPELTVEENLAVAALRGQARGLGRGLTRTRRSLFWERLAGLGMGLEHRLRQMAGLLSGGERQALALLMATLIPPRLLLLDEPASALDPSAGARINKMVIDLNQRQGITTLMVTHNMHDALRFGQRMIMMHKGEIILDLAQEEVRGLTPDALVKRFYDVKGWEVFDDTMVL